MCVLDKKILALSSNIHAYWVTRLPRICCYLVYYEASIYLSYRPACQLKRRTKLTIDANIDVSVKSNKAIVTKRKVSEQFEKSAKVLRRVDC